MGQLEVRVDRLETILGEFIVQTKSALLRLDEDRKDMNKKWADLANKTGILADEMKAFKDEMKDFKDEMKAFKDEMKQDRKDMNKKWGELANKMGTIVEDIIYPAVRPALKKYFNLEPECTSINIKVKKNGENGEFDVIAICNNRLFLIEVKETPRNKHIEEIKKKMERFTYFFPEHKEKIIIPIMGSLRFDENFIHQLSMQHIYALGFREWEYMDILNYDEVTLR